MFLPNHTCLYYARTNTQDLYGNYSYANPITLPCSVVTMDLKVAKTSVRADSSASRGRAEEEVGLVRILFSNNAVIAEGDLVQVDGEIIEVIRIFPRRDVIGNLDHYQVDFRKGALPSS